MKHLHGNRFAAIDFELAGEPYESDPIQVGIAVFDHTLTPTGETFCELIRPNMRISDAAFAVHGIADVEVMNAPPPGVVEDMLTAWIASLDLPYYKRLVPIAHNWTCEASTLARWLGAGFAFQTLFHFAARDTFTLAAALKDGGLLPDDLSLSLASLCAYFNVSHDSAHDALGDALAAGKLYKKLLEKFSSASFD